MSVSKRMVGAVTAVLIAGLVSTSLAALPDPGVTIDERTALVVTDPQNDFLSPDGVTWGVVGESVTKNGTVENIDALFVRDATAAAIVPEGDGYAAALVNFRFTANTVWSTAQATERIRAAGAAAAD